MHGAGKAAILADIFGPEVDPTRWPAQLDAPRGGDVDPRRGGGRQPASALMAGPAAGASPRSADEIEIRRAEAGDAGGIGDVWLASWRVDVRLRAVASR